MSGIVGGTAQNLNVRNNVYDDDPGVLAWVPETQPLIKTDTLNVNSDVTDRAARELGKVTVTSGAITETNSGSIKTAVEKIPSQGQALEGASLPVVLTAAQIITLTPPAAITGFATSAKQLPDGHNVVVTSLPSITGSVAITGTPTFNLTKVMGEDCQVSGGSEEKAIRVTIANNSTGLLSVDDNDGSLTIDGETKALGLVSLEILPADSGNTVPLSLTADRQLRVISYNAPVYLDFFGGLNIWGETDNFGGTKGCLNITKNPFYGF